VAGLQDRSFNIDKAACDSRRQGAVMNTEEQITRFIESELLEGAGPGVDPLTSGMLDSLAIEFLIGWVEEEFEISLKL